MWDKDYTILPNIDCLLINTALPVWTPILTGPISKKLKQQQWKKCDVGGTKKQPIYKTAKFKAQKNIVVSGKKPLKTELGIKKEWKTGLYPF